MPRLTLATIAVLASAVPALAAPGNMPTRAAVGIHLRGPRELVAGTQAAYQVTGAGWQFHPELVSRLVAAGRARPY